jgi:hypothetical protein
MWNCLRALLFSIQKIYFYQNLDNMDAPIKKVKDK